jgi:hypothetical protein
MGAAAATAFPVNGNSYVVGAPAKVLIIGVEGTARVTNAVSGTAVTEALLY